MDWIISSYFEQFVRHTCGNQWDDQYEKVLKCFSGFSLPYLAEWHLIQKMVMQKLSHFNYLFVFWVHDDELLLFTSILELNDMLLWKLIIFLCIYLLQPFIIYGLHLHNRQRPQIIFCICRKSKSIIIISCLSLFYLNIYFHDNHLLSSVSSEE